MIQDKLTEDDVRSALGLYKYKNERDKAASTISGEIKKKEKPEKISKTPISIEYMVRRKNGGKTFSYTYDSESISLFEAELEAKKAIEAKGWDIWFVVERRRNQ